MHRLIARIVQVSVYLSFEIFVLLHFFFVVVWFYNCTTTNIYILFVLLYYIDGWYGGDSLSSESGLLKCKECDCDAKYCNDGNNGTGRCTHPPRPNTPSGSNNKDIIPTVVVASGCGLAFLGVLFCFMQKNKKKTRSTQHQKEWETQTINDPLISQTNNVNHTMTTPTNAYEADTSNINYDEGVDEMGGETLEDRLKRMSALMAAE